MMQLTTVLGGVPLCALTTFVRCADCGLVFQTPHLDEASLAEMYTSGTYRALLNAPKADQDASEMERQKRIATHLPTHGSFLDIGCGRGYLVQLARERGCVPVMGIDLDAERISKDIPYTTNLDDISGEWDTIACIHNLEHVYHLQATANRIISLLAPGGKLIVEVPGEKSQGSPYSMYHTYVIPPWIMLQLFAPLKRELFEVNPHHLHIFRKAEE
jgi:SAM-dependent methyltransferase